MEPHVISTPAGELIEFPVSVAELCGRRVCVFGGGYLRLAPLALIRRLTRRVLNESRPVVFYLHPREIDPDHPHLPMGPVRRFKSYVNLRSAEEKTRALLSEFQFKTFRETSSRILRDHPSEFDAVTGTTGTRVVSLQMPPEDASF
jgi:hypothetical protein